ncbi:MAG: hypothetical protein J7J80_00175 [Thermotogae bacterium]|nr:hypothetical protein [Thermotogota bacterium]
MRRKRFSKLTGHEIHSNVISTNFLLSPPDALESNKIDLLKCYVARNEGECVILLEDAKTYRTLVFSMGRYRWMEITLHSVKNPNWWRYNSDLRSLFLIGYTNKEIGKPTRRYFVGTLHFADRDVNLIDSLTTLKKIESILGGW